MLGRVKHLFYPDFNSVSLATHTFVVAGFFPLHMIADCGIPKLPLNGHVHNFINSKLMDTISFQCSEAYVPSLVISSKCIFGGFWIPDPEEHNCTLIVGKYFYSQDIRSLYRILSILQQVLV